jgi:uncharacterized protein YaeQ
MALKATIFKIELQLADLDRGYYQTHTLTLARHPSETDERMMVRVMAFALRAHDALEFGRGLSTDDEPDLWRKDLTGAIEEWIEVGLPDEKRLRRGSGRSAAVFVFAYGGRAAEVWWEQNQTALRKLEKLSVLNLPQPQTEALAQLVTRTMQINCTLQEGELWLVIDGATLQLTPETWLTPDK